MSRIGKKPVVIPDGVEVKIDGQVVTAKGPLGTETVELREEVTVKVENNEIIVDIKDHNDRKSRALWGLSRTLVNNAVEGVKHGFTKKLEIQGVGYRANMEGSNLNLVLGYSHPVLVTPPEGIKISVEANTKITVTGSNKQMVGDVAAEIRGKRPPEVYKGKGVRYEGEYVRRKAGKTGKK
ncbi:MAG: 50S ribosomal protein L6 [Candidatus Gastranaerophilaceae bacterium]|jgi:ribosomal protein L6|nr:ribosomal protein L6 [uncultured bacterium]MBS6553011.1 50S ribosomal protein L6 [Clostridium sp.]CDC18333.1 50S ribosomal protein L6 [Clostridium sp. CAG:306]